jgi:glyoxylase-like metal-dependent hydrolase (beta-lactamase superfamily II)
MWEAHPVEPVRDLPVRDPWFERQEVAPGITWILEPAVHGFLRSNIWHVSGRDRDLVVDTGMGISSLQGALPDLFGRDPIAFLTHGHYDHTGGAHEFDSRVGHAAEAGMLAVPEAATLVTAELPASFAEALAADEPGGVCPAYLVDAVPHDAFDVATYEVRPAPLTDQLADGDVIDLGDRSFEVVHLPGHTPGSAALLDRAAGVLFTGDVLYDGELLDELPESSIDDYRASMARLLALDIEVAYPGHEQPLSQDDVQRLGSAYLDRRAS